jgi:hypothetical protein
MWFPDDATILDESLPLIPDDLIKIRTEPPNLTGIHQFIYTYVCYENKPACCLHHVCFFVPKGCNVTALIVQHLRHLTLQHLVKTPAEIQSYIAIPFTFLPFLHRFYTLSPKEVDTSSSCTAIAAIVK